MQVPISQSFWRGHLLEPKTRQSKAPVAVIAHLAQRLDCHRILAGSPANGLMFPSPAGKPINLDALAADVIVPAVNKAGVPWHGWHAFRRGLATNLRPSRSFRHDDTENLAALQRSGYTELLHQNGRFGSGCSSEAI